jgi:hypothetical protein
MDVEKAGTALANGDLEGFMALCDESERLTAGQGTMIIGRMGKMTVEFTTDGAEGNRLEAHAHPSVEDAGACYANMVTVAHQEAVKVNFLLQCMGYDARVSVSGTTPDYIPGDWTTV